MPPIEGKNWNAEVVDRSFKREKIRNEFYEKLAKLKLGIETNPETVLGNPSASGLKTYEELAGASDFSSETKKGSTLSAVLHTYFRENLGITDAKTRGREVALSLYALTRQKDTEGRAINVDYLNLKWKIEIKAGQLFISDHKGEKIVDGADLRKRVEGSAAAAAASAESVGNLSEAASRFVTRLREKSKEKKSLDEILGKVQEGLSVGKQKIDAVIETAAPEEIANATNAWRAWTRDGFLKGPENLELRKSLQKFIFDSEEEIPPAHKKYARQLWRTEMVSHISKKLETSSRGDKPVVMEKIMGVMRVTDSEDEPAEALKSAMFLDPKIKNQEVRQGLTKKMEASGTRGSAAEVLSQLKFLKTGETVSTIKVVVGGDFISIPAEQAINFKYKHAIFVESENRIYAQMENGCMGNLVIIEKVPAPAPAPPPAPPGPPPPGPKPPKPPPPGPGPKPPSEPDIPEGSGKTPVPPRPGVPEGSGKTPVPPKPAVPEGSGRTAVPPRPNVPEGSGKTTVPPRPAPAPLPPPEGGGRTTIPAKPAPAPPMPIPEGGGKTEIPPKPSAAPVPEGSGRTAIPAKPAPAPAPPPEGGGRTTIPAKPAPAPPMPIPEGSGKTAIPPKPAAPIPAPEGGGKTTIPTKPSPAPPAPAPEGGGKSTVPPKPPPAPAPEGRGKTAVPPPPEGGGKTAIPPLDEGEPIRPPE